MQSKDRKERIGIIGAGAAGISMAVYLRDSGYRNVIVLEKESQAGGKCRTFRRGNLNWELGAVLGTTDYEATADLMRRVGIKKRRSKNHPLPSDDSFIPEFYPMDKLFPGWVTPAEAIAGARQIARYHKLSLKYGPAFAPGHAGVPEELHVPFSEWVSSNGMETLAKLYSIPFTTFGYGYYEDIPAAYVLKYFDPGITRALIFSGKFFNWEEGVQTVWTRLAANLDVRYGLSVSSIRRNGGVAVEALDAATGAKSSFEFDSLIIACPWDEMVAIMDSTEEERDLASRILHTDYRVYLMEIDGLRIPGGFAPGRFGREGLGRPMIWGQRNLESNVYTWYILADGKMSDEDVEALLDEDIRRLGGVTKNIVTKVRWKYFPHVSCEDYRALWYRRFEAIQGSRNTFVTGEIASFSTIERTIRYSRDIAKRFFA